MKALVTALALAALGSGAVAQPSVPEPRPQPVPMGFYTSAAVGYPIGSSGLDSRYLTLHVHASAGVVLGRPLGLHVRLGPTFEAFVPLALRGHGLPAFGPELQLDVPVNPCWRVGLRIAGGPMADKNDSTLWMIGARARSPVGSLGVDVFGFRSDDPNHADSKGVLVNAGLEGRPARIALVVGAVAAGVVALSLMSQIGGA